MWLAQWVPRLSSLGCGLSLGQGPQLCQSERESCCGSEQAKDTRSTGELGLQVVNELGSAHTDWPGASLVPEASLFGALCMDTLAYAK